MTEELHDHVTELLEAADRGVDSLPPLEEASEDDVYDAAGDSDDLLEAAEDARALLSTTDSRDLLEALGLAELPDGSEAETIPEAIVGGDQESVADLRVLLKLARVADADHDGEGFEDALEALRDVVESRDEAADRGDGDPAESDTAEATEADEAPGDETDAETDVESEDESADESDDDGLESELRSTVGDALEGFGDDVRDVRDRLEAATVDEDEDEGADDEAEEEAEETDDETGEDDDSMLDAFDADDAASGRPTMYSTMAPPPSERADMRRRTGYSTMPDR